MSRTLWINWAVDRDENVVMRAHADRAEADAYPNLMGLDERAYVRFACIEIEVPADGEGIKVPASVEEPRRMAYQRRSQLEPGACPYCDRMRAEDESFFPSHDPSGSCASGGHPHCSCSTCF